LTYLSWYLILNLYPTKVNFYPPRLQCRGFNPCRPAAIVFSIDIYNLNVIRFMFSHHLISIHSVQHAMHNRPLLIRQVPSSLSFLLWKLHDTSCSDITPQLVLFYIHTAPYDISRPTYTAQSSSSLPKEHRRLTQAIRSRIPSYKM